MKIPVALILIFSVLATLTAAEIQTRVFLVPATFPKFSEFTQPRKISVEGNETDFAGHMFWGILTKEESDKYAKDIKFSTTSKITLPHDAVAQIEASKSVIPSFFDVKIKISGPNHWTTNGDNSLLAGQSLMYCYYPKDRSQKPLLFAIQIKN